MMLEEVSFIPVKMFVVNLQPPATAGGSDFVYSFFRRRLRLTSRAKTSGRE